MSSIPLDIIRRELNQSVRPIISPSTDCGLTMAFVAGCAYKAVLLYIVKKCRGRGNSKILFPFKPVLFFD
jgi:hypothetical protein